MAKKSEEKEVKLRPKALLKVYLTNGAHFDIPVESGVDPERRAGGFERGAGRRPRASCRAQFRARFRA